MYIYIYIHTYVALHAVACSVPRRTSCSDRATVRRHTQVGKHKSARKREYARIMLPLMSQIRFRILGWG